MENKGLCSTCVEFNTCLFVKEPAVLQCEEFSIGNHTPKKSGQAKRVVSCAQTTESE